MPADRSNKENSLKFRCTPEQRRHWEKAATKSQRILSDWVRLALDRQADAELTDDEPKGKKR